MKEALVVGGSGFIGGIIAARLAAQGTNVMIIDKRPLAHELPSNVRFKAGNATDTHLLDSSPSSFDAIFHFGSPSSMELFARDPIGCSSETLCGFINVLEFAKRNHIEPVVFPSSGTVYGESAGSDEKRLEPINLYGVLKLAEEKVAATYRNAVRTIGLRIFMGYGPGEETKGDIGSPVFLFLRDVLAGRRPVVWGDGTQTRDLIYIDDIAEVAIKAATESFVPPIFDVGTGKPTSFRDILALIAIATRHRLEAVYVEPPRSYQTATRANPDVTRKLLGREFTTPALGIRAFYNHLLTTRRAAGPGRANSKVSSKDRGPAK